MIEEPVSRCCQATGLALRTSSPADRGRLQYGRYMSCWMSSSRSEDDFTGDVDLAREFPPPQPPSASSCRPEPAADEVVVDDHLIYRQPSNLRCRIVTRVSPASPSKCRTRLAAHARCSSSAPSSLGERASRQVASKFASQRAFERALEIAFLPSNCSRGCSERLASVQECSQELTLAFRAFIPLDFERGDSLLRCPGIVGHDAPTESLSLRRFDGTPGTALASDSSTDRGLRQDRRNRERRETSSRDHDVDPIDRLAVLPCRKIEPLRRGRADQLDSLWGLSATLSGFSTGNFAAASTRAPYFNRRPLECG